VGVQLLALSTSGFFAFNVVLVLCWLVAGVLLVKEHRHASTATTSQSSNSAVKGITAKSHSI